MLWLVPLFPVAAALLLFPAWVNSRSRLLIACSAATVVGIDLFLVVWAESAGWTGAIFWNEHLTLTIGLTPMTFLASLVVPIVAAPIVFYAAVHEDSERLARLTALLVAFTGVMELLILARELLSLLIAWEIAGALSWSLIGHRFQDQERGRHALQAFLTTRTGDLGLYLAVFVAFQQTGGLEYGALGQMSPAAMGLFAAGVGMAAFSKSAQLPFSPWLFAAMSGPASVSALLHAATMVAAGVILLLQFQPVLASVSWFGPLLMAVGLATALAAAFVAMSTPHAKRLLAASTSAHFGLMFVAIGAGHPEIALLHFSMHALMKAPLFMIAGVAGHQAGTYDLGAIARSPAPPSLKFVSWVAVLALAGLVPLGSAWTKEEVIASAGLVAPWLALLAALAGGLSALYAARFQFSLFSGRAAADKGRASEQPSAHMLQNAPIYALAMLVLLTSAIWLPGLRSNLEQMLAVSFPSGKLWELVLSLALVLAGLYGGYRLAFRNPGQVVGQTASRFFGQWMWLPHLANRLAAVPVNAVATRLATFDDKVVDTGVRGSAGSALWLAKQLARLDDLVVDAGIRGSARFTLWLAKVGDRFYEWLFDSLPEGLARLSARAGHTTRQLQSGELHHYYSLMAIGVGVLALALVLATITGGLP